MRFLRARGPKTSKAGHQEMRDKESGPCGQCRRGGGNTSRAVARIQGKKAIMRILISSISIMISSGH